MAPKLKRAKVQAYDIDEFKSSASKFSKYEEEALKIDIQGADSVSEMFPEYPEVQVGLELDHLKLEGFDYDKVLTFVPSMHKDLSDGQRRFLIKLRHVLRNSISQGPDPRFESYVQTMVDTFLQECKLDDAIELDIVPSMLRMRIADEMFSTFSDREGRKGDQLVWVLQESKHKNDIRYKNGEIQLVSALIAACQQNYSTYSSNIIPEVMYGINIKGDEVSVVRAVFTKEYIISLFGGLPEQKLEIKRYPSAGGLRLSSFESRVEILSLMTKLRRYALSINTNALGVS